MSEHRAAIGRIPEGAEAHAYSDHSRPVKAPSKFVEGAEVQVGVIYVCPRCQDEKQGIPHGTVIACSCGLNAAVFGNGLFLWEGEITDVRRGAGQQPVLLRVPKGKPRLN